MVLEIINLQDYYLKKAAPYLLMAFTLVLYAFPFKFPYNTFNWIQKYDLPAYTYPVFIVLFIISFILMIVSFFSSPSITRKLSKLKDGSIHHNGAFYRVSNMIDFKLEGRHDLYIENKTVYKFSAKFKEGKISMHLLLSHGKKNEFEDYLKIMHKK
mgnify:FL=1|tara:strand:+ start:8592 stop:9059 length:468 start_codon:yes stop_codon:yes gene_type:complete